MKPAFSTFNAPFKGFLNGTSAITETRFYETFQSFKQQHETLEYRYQVDFTTTLNNRPFDDLYMPIWNGELLLGHRTISAGFPPDAIKHSLCLNGNWIWVVPGERDHHLNHRAYLLTYLLLEYHLAHTRRVKSNHVGRMRTTIDGLQWSGNSHVPQNNAAVWVARSNRVTLATTVALMQTAFINQYVLLWARHNQRMQSADTAIDLALWWSHGWLM